MNSKKKRLLLIIVGLIVLLLVGAGTYAYWTWTSNENKNIVFNTSNGIKDYIIYDEGESKFVGDFKVTDSYTEGMHTTISIRKTEVVADIDLYATINMNINAIGNNMKNSSALKWTLTSGNASTTNKEVLASGNFLNTDAGDTIILYSGIEVLTTVKEFTVWLWIDSSLNPSSELVGETLDTSIWTQVDQIVEDKFEITKKSVNYQVLKVTAVNTKNNIVSYGVTTSNTEPSSWTSIPSADQNRIYNLEYKVTATGTYYVWFKDSSGKVVSGSVTVSSMDTTAPTITLGSNGDTVSESSKSVVVTIRDTGSGLKSGASLKYGWSTSNTTAPSSYTTVTPSYTEGTTDEVTFTATGSGYTGKYYLWVVPNTLSDMIGNSNTTTVKSSGTFEFDNRAPASSLTVTLSGSSFTYTGSEIKPTVTVKDGNTTLSVNTDYTVSYSDNINAGIATVTITGKGNYAGSISKTFTITKANATCTISSVPTLTYPGSKTGAVSYNCTGDGTITLSSGSNIVTATKTNNTTGTLTANGAGTATITVIQSEGTNYKQASASKDITITVNQYTVTLDANIFNTISTTNHGITATYEVSDSYFYVTLNGTQTSETAWLGAIPYGYSFTEGDTFTGKFTYVSGSYSYPSTSSSDYVRLILRTVTGDGTKVAVLNSPRNFVQGYFPSSTDTVTTRQMTVNSTVANTATGISLNIYAVTPSSLTFNNYKIKIELTKDETKTISYGNKYGTLPTPTRLGYSFDGWYTGEKGTGTKITSDTVYNVVGNQTLYAKWVDDVPPYGTAKLTFASGTYTLALTGQGDEGNGLNTTYGFALTSGTCESASYTNQTGTSKTYNSGLTAGTTYYGCIKLTDKAGNVAYLRSVGIPYSVSSGSDNLYSSSGAYTYTAPVTGNYKLETWGAQGGSVTYSSATYRGGYGGYSTGTVSLKKGDVLYVHVGGAGTGGIMQESFPGGYNGGGSMNIYGSDHYSASGGGATHIATKNGLLSTLSSSLNSILIVSGGGGGGYVHTGSSLYSSLGGDGGGMNGTDATLGGYNAKQGLGGTQTAGGKYNGSTESSSTIFGSFGQGGVPDKSWGSAGGGGYYGGGASYASTGGNGNSGGGGGSGYIGNSLLTDKLMYCYNCATSSDTATKTYSTTNVSSTPTANYAKSGSGAAKITLITADSIKLTYDTNGGVGCYSKSVLIDSTYGTLCTPTREGYSFDGWYTAASGGSSVTSSTKVSSTSDHTIYAHWTAANSPIITFGTNGNSSYVKGNVSSKITVTKGTTDLNTSTFKYIWSTSNSATPNTSFSNNATVTLSSKTGIYYLIVTACSTDGACTTKVSDPFYVDSTVPTGSVALSFDNNSNMLKATVTASDSGSGIAGYGYLIQTSSSCPTTGYVSSSNSTYNFNITESATYYVCVKLSDKAGNVTYVSKSLVVDASKKGSDIVNDRTNVANLSNDLVGNLYRYQGTASNVTNNYICFGTNNKSTCTGNPATYMYRIIGIDTTGRMKIIKKEALDSTTVWSSSTNEWQYAQLYTNLNGSTFLNNTTFVPSGWSDKIATYTWNYGKQSDVLNKAGTVIYDYELGSNATFTSTVSAKIALMYMHDYYLALDNTTSCGYGGYTYSQCKAGWIHISQNDSSPPSGSEWTMSAAAQNNGGVASAWIVYTQGYTTNYKVTSYLSARPVFFLNSSVSILDGDGTISNPYLIN